MFLGVQGGPPCLPSALCLTKEDRRKNAHGTTTCETGGVLWSVSMAIPGGTEGIVLRQFVTERQPEVPETGVLFPEAVNEGGMQVLPSGVTEVCVSHSDTVHNIHNVMDTC